MAKVQALVDPKLVAAGHYQCARCREIFRIAVSDEDARKEEADYFGRNADDAQMVCEPCFNAIEREARLAEDEARRKEMAKTQFTRAQRQQAEDLVTLTLSAPVELGGKVIEGGLTLAELVEYAEPTIGLNKKERTMLMSHARQKVYAERGRK